MLRLLKNLLWIAALVAGSQASWAFSLLGPVANGGDAWQVPADGFNPIPNENGNPPFIVDTATLGPKNYGEGYRRNTPLIVCACDANFLNFFGSNGLAAVEQSLDILNNVFTNNPTGQTSGLDGYSSDLSEFSLDTMQENYQANALALLDLKSVTLQLMVEELGLTDSIRYIWVVRNRFQGPTCPGGVLYAVTMRNFDVVPAPVNQYPFGQYSPYVNGSLYSYFLYEICAGAPGGPTPPPNVDALEIPVSRPFGNTPPVSSIDIDGFSAGTFAARVGFFYTGLTRDDVGGLRYLLSSNNIVNEVATPDSLLIVSNALPPVLVTTLPLSYLISAASNPPDLLLATPGLTGLQISSVTTNYSLVLVTNFVAVLTNQIGAPFGSPPILVVFSNVDFAIGTNFTYTFGNVITNNLTTNTTITVQTINVQNQNGAPVGSPPVTNVTNKKFVSHAVNGEILIIPTNWCGFSILSTSPPIKSFFTNNIFAFTTNFNFTTVTLFAAVSQQTITTFTNHVLLIQPDTCTTGPSDVRPRRGIEKIHLAMANFDSLLGQAFQPITNIYYMTYLTNSKSMVQAFERVITAPDVLFSAADIQPGPAANNSGFPEFNRSLGTANFDQTQIGTALAGPGVIDTPTTITFNKVGPVFMNTGTASLNLSTASGGYMWGSYDGSTNDPVIYPNGTSIQNLANEALVQISPTSLPLGTNNQGYATTTFTTTGGAFTTPFTWSLAGTSLPTGLGLSPDGILSGTPTQTGTFDFIVQLTDSLGRAVQWNYSITID